MEALNTLLLRQWHVWRECEWCGVVYCTTDCPTGHCLENLAILSVEREAAAREDEVVGPARDNAQVSSQAKEE